MIPSLYDQSDRGSPGLTTDMVSPVKRNEADKPYKVERWFSSAAEISQSLRSQDEQGLLGGAVRDGYYDPQISYSP